MAKVKDAPTYLFWVYELALDRGDAKAATKAAAKLKAAGFIVKKRAITKGGAR